MAGGILSVGQVSEYWTVPVEQGLHEAVGCQHIMARSLIQVFQRLPQVFINIIFAVCSVEQARAKLSVGNTCQGAVRHGRRDDGGCVFSLVMLDDGLSGGGDTGSIFLVFLNV